MSLARIGVLVAAVAAASSILTPTAQAAPQGKSGLAFTSVSPTRLHDTRVTGDRIAARGSVKLAVPQLPDDAAAVLVNVTATNPDGPTFLTAGTSSFAGTTSTVNVRAGETRANLAVVPIDRDSHSFYVAAGPNAADAVIDLAGYYSAGGAAKYTPVAPQRVLDTRSSAPVGPNGTVTLDLSGQVPAGATSVTFNLTATNVTASTFVTAFPAGQQRPATSNLNPEPGQDTPNLVTVGLGADRKVTLANAAGSVDLIADLAGYYSPQSTQAFYPLKPLRVVDTRDYQEQPRDPITAGADRRVDLSGWLPAGATAAVFNLTATNASAATFLTAHPADQPRSSASTSNVVAGQTAAAMATVAVSPDRAVSVFNAHGQVDVLVDVAGYFAPSQAACQRGCVYGFGVNTVGQAGNGTVGDALTPTTAVYGLDSVIAASNYYGTQYALKSDGTVWAWGGAGNGALGNGPVAGGDLPDLAGPAYPYATFPVRISGLTNITAVSTQMALRSDGTVWVWGQNGYKHLGVDFPHGQYDTPVQVTELSNVVAVAGNTTTSYALKSDGTVWSWGWNSGGALGNGTVPGPLDCPVKSSDADKGPNCASGIPVQVKDLTNVTAIAPAVAVKSDGTLWRWGARGSQDQDIVPVAVPGVHDARAVVANGSDYVLRADGTVWAWGTGYLGDGRGSHAFYVDTPVKAQGLAGVRAIATTGLASYAVTADGAEYAWGGGQDGLLGDGKFYTQSQVPTPVPGVSGVTALSSNGYAVTGS
ncbi:RCC1 domain-containing protein [Kutzneria sp. NPDC052558]|uniref:RCC1 domain-containing protein n=1 Tax=Kutzneria sp. NPDC052558 TaxID=3364121 RepID=UPI0037C9B8A4